MHNIYKSKGHTYTMQVQRIKYLEEEIEKFPEDPFNYYALALEYSKNHTDKAAKLWEKLLNKFPDYLPTYYQAANFFFAQAYLRKAESIFQKGIELALQQNNLKTHQELLNSYSLFKSEIDDDL